MSLALIISSSKDAKPCMKIEKRKPSYSSIISLLAVLESLGLRLMLTWRGKLPLSRDGVWPRPSLKWLPFLLVSLSMLISFQRGETPEVIAGWYVDDFKGNTSDSALIKGFSFRLRWCRDIAPKYFPWLIQYLIQDTCTSPFSVIVVSVARSYSMTRAFLKIIWFLLT